MNLSGVFGGGGGSWMRVIMACVFSVLLGHPIGCEPIEYSHRILVITRLIFAYVNVVLFPFLCIASLYFEAARNSIIFSI